ncbi:MAG TPA: acyltransferase [Acidobacteriaceae bacterium]|jgi:peptidoglycan/LPS O-acetylase OafA/YrhL
MKNANAKRDNNFDILRLTLAIVVVFFHSALISNSPSLAWLPNVFSGHLAVEGFFSISGFLILASYERSKSLKDYFWRRAGRILPGYWLATIFCLAIAFSSGCFHVGRFLFANLTFANFLQPSIPGLWDTNPGTNIVDGALWTLKIEVMFYLVVPLIVWLCRKLRRDAVLWTLFALSIAYRIGMAKHPSLAVQLPGQLSFFMIGGLIHYHQKLFYKYGRWMMAVAAAMFVVHTFTGWYVLRPAAVAVLTLGAALLLPVVKGPARWGDFSYSTYVLHWPILQIVAAAGLFALHPWGALGLAFLMIAVGAVISWFLVEKPALDRVHAHAQRFKQPVPAVIPS